MKNHFVFYSNAKWGLMERAPWGRIVVIVAAYPSLIRFPSAPP